MNLNMYDVIISGAGPAGSKCAEVLAKSGFKVALIEKNTQWRKPCGGAVSSRIFKYYPQIRKLNFHKITGMIMYSSDYNKLKYSWEGIKHHSINVDRLIFDNYVRNVAIDVGAELFDKNISYDFIIKYNNRIGIKTKTSSGTKEYLGKIIIIADGMSSKLAIKSGLRDKWKIEELGLVKCAIMEGKNNLDKDCMSTFFKPYKGYAWIFPLGEERFNIGCGTFGEDNLNLNLNQLYLEFINDPNIKKLLPKSNYKEIWKGAYPVPTQGVNDESLYGENILLIGDAAGFVSPISGEGIHAGIVSGNIAAETAISALENDNISNLTLKSYKTHQYIKKIIRNFKMKRSMVDFFFENKGYNFSNMLKLANKDSDIKEKVINMFLLNQPLTKELLLRIKSTNE